MFSMTGVYACYVTPFGMDSMSDFGRFFVLRADERTGHGLGRRKLGAPKVGEPVELAGFFSNVKETRQELSFRLGLKKNKLGSVVTLGRWPQTEICVTPLGTPFISILDNPNCSVT